LGSVNIAGEDKFLGLYWIYVSEEIGMVYAL